jgi:hypothetical protein
MVDVRLVLVTVVMLCSAGCAKDFTKIKTVYQDGEAQAVAACSFKGRVQDDDMRDVLKRAYQLGGDTVVMKPNVYKLTADAYRCEGAPVVESTTAPASSPAPSPASKLKPCVDMAHQSGADVKTDAKAFWGFVDECLKR